MFKFNKNILILIFGVILVIFFIFIIVRPFIFKNKHDNFSINKDIKVEEYVKDRFIKNQENSIYIGKNQKEIENGYIDIKIEYLEDNVLVYFNKIYKEEKVENIYVDEKYLLEVIKYINEAFLLNIDERNIYELVILIKDKYIRYRVDKKEEFNDIYSFNTNYNYEFSILNDMLALKITNN